VFRISRYSDYTSKINKPFIKKKRSKHNQKKSQICVKIVKLLIKKLLVLKKKGQNTTTKSQSCVKIVKLPIKKLSVFFFSLIR
jgi:DNA topoisomerase VI subunit B